MTFNEKIQWIKTHYHDPLLTMLADKYLVREYVREKVGDYVLNQIYGVFYSVDEIEFDKLPSSFVIKAAHGSGWNIICKNKNELNWQDAKKRMAEWISDNYYYYGREWAYKNIRPKIIIEKYLDEAGKIPLDYKIFCFNGQPKFVQIDIDRFENHTRKFFDLDWNELPFSIIYPISSTIIDKPKNFDSMIEIVKKLSDLLLFTRVDLYSINSQIIFGEMTFYPENGGGKFIPDIYDKTVGEYLDLKLH